MSKERALCRQFPTDTSRTADRCNFRGWAMCLATVTAIALQNHKESKVLAFWNHSDRCIYNMKEWMSRAFFREERWALWALPQGLEEEGEVCVSLISTAISRQINFLWLIPATERNRAAYLKCWGSKSRGSQITWICTYVSCLPWQQ